ncbi:uncharacterized protein PHACADRAFT_153519 [Phanerochaete carnosa HHB-10118-sp]|uniref:Uncharacterized protein n=1 Tax=Phanerochaete carnosa (strain HHB-10118-sp) TaxID=650164 RepID=K5VU68_PHACS|nr:uncharacterized protein PHACADRAFT_153519 [Phanerochaete carnosa HHB-10118-sp]EKM50129.1 hypothetical protein PHACADRAFT_153519 [Phanerochaete carnosa HHB-10118-sp]
MCVGENNAPQAQHYLNAQLGALYENAVGCVERHGKGLQPDADHKYSFAPAEFYYGKHRRGQASKADMMFYTSFGKPKLEFICNHDVIIRLTLKEGHYNTEFSKGNANPAIIEKNKSFKEAEIAFRVPFTVEAFPGQAVGLAGSDNVISLVILNFPKAQLVQINSELEVGRQALAFYLSEYLLVLQSAGNHVLFSLPDFDDDRRRLFIDFSTYARSLLDVDEIYDISVEKINTFLSSSWLKAAMLAGGKNGPSADHAALSLAEYQSNWSLDESSNTHFHIKLGSPRIKALCNQEVVLYFVIDEVLFYDSKDFSVAAKQTYQNWELALLINVVYEKEEEGKVTRCKLDFNSCRFMRQLCQWADFDQTNEDALRYVQKLVDFFTGEYLDVLEQAHYNVVYHYDERWPPLSGVPEAEHEEIEAEDAELIDEESDSEDEEEVVKGDVSTYRELGAGGATIVEGVAASAAAGAAAGVAIIEGSDAAASAAGAEAGKAARRALTAKAGPVTPRVIRQGTVSRTPEGKTILTKHNGTVVEYVSKAAAVKELIEKTHTHGFDHVSAVSQASINAWFKSLWSVASTSKSTVDSLLSRFAYEQYFSTKFQAPTLRLLSNNRAIIWLHLQDGWLKTLKNWQPWNESEAYKFDNWRLAFEVELKLADSDKLQGVSTAWNAKLEDSFAYKQHGKKDDRVLKHIYLDFKTAEFIHDLSSFDGLFHSHEKRPIEKVQALVTYLREYYFSQIIATGTHVLYTLPVFKAGASLPSANALTDLTFQIYSKIAYDRRNWAAMAKEGEPALLILGMTQFRALPAAKIEWSGSWIANSTRSVSYGTVCLSKQIFLQERLLGLLAKVNGETTVSSQPFRLECKGAWKLQLTTWAANEDRKKCVCTWKFDGEADGMLKYKWIHRDGWKYEHEGTTDITNGTYWVDCHTVNYLEIPTTFTNGQLEIKLRGDVKVSLGVDGGAQKWSTKSGASWRTSICIGTSEDGLKVSVPAPPVPVYLPASTIGEALPAFWNDPEALLRAHLPQTVDLGDVLGLFRTFEGTYTGLFPGTSAFTLANPAFNKDGDVLFELVPHTQLSASAPLVSKAAARAAGTAAARDHRTYASSVRPRGEHRSLSLLQRVKNKLTGDHDDEKHRHADGKPANGSASPAAPSPVTPAVESPAASPPTPPAAKGGRKDAKPEKA